MKGIFRILLGLNEGRPGHATDASPKHKIQDFIKEGKIKWDNRKNGKLLRTPTRKWEFFLRACSLVTLRSQHAGPRKCPISNIPYHHYN